MKHKLTNLTTFKRFKCVDPEKNHNKFYELSVEMLLFGPTVIRRWGRIGLSSGGGREGGIGLWKGRG
jgi:predicted DNA-binding WGR domain protein